MQESRLAAFLNYIREETGIEFGELGPDAYAKMHSWSVENLEQFYSEVLNFSGLIYEQGQKGIENIDDILNAEFFPDTKISFAENMLKRVKSHPDDPAIIARTAGRDEDRILSWQDLYNEVSRWSQLLEKLDVGDDLHRHHDDLAAAQHRRGDEEAEAEDEDHQRAGEEPGRGEREEHRPEGRAGVGAEV